jgi:beta-glucosidase/6-phospho-beta-glucosidase/beta-galactosidase
LYLGSGNGKAPSIPEYNDITIWPYIGGHNVLLAHAAVVKRYRSKFQLKQQGTIGMTNNMDWREPKTSDPLDVGAAERCVEFWLGWFTDPLYTVRTMICMHIIIIIYIYKSIPQSNSQSVCIICLGFLFYDLYEERWQSTSTSTLQIK